MQVLRRTQLGLQESLLPHHAEKCERLFLKFEESQSIIREIAVLKTVRGFAKAALAMEWIIKRASHNNNQFTSDRFEADISLMNDKLFEAFLSEPFEPPPGQPAEVSNDPFEPVQEPIIVQETDKEIMIADSINSVPSAVETVTEPQTEPETSERQSERMPGDQRGLSDIFDQNFILAFQRFTAMILTLTEKSAQDRKSVLPLITMIAKGSVDVARGLNRKEVADFFQSVVKFLSFVNGKGLADDERVAVLLRDIGEQLLGGLEEKTGGVKLLYSIVEKLEQHEAILNN